MPEKLLTQEEVAELLAVSRYTVRQWRYADPYQGPPYFKLSRRCVRYPLEELLTWIQEHRHVP